MNLTNKQQALLNFIEDFQLQHGKSPTLKEMRAHFKVKSDNSVLKPLKVLVEKGYVQKDDTPRGIKLLPAIKKRFEAIDGMVTLPLLGRIPAGQPTMTDEFVEDTVALSSQFVKKPQQSFLLRVKGESMIDAGIFDGDLVIVTSAIEPRVGNIVVALIDNENTLKRLVKKDGKYYLKSENSDYNDFYPRQSLEIQGVVTGLFRNF